MQSFRNYITELFDQPAKFTKEKEAEDAFAYRATIDGRELILATFVENSVWMINFQVDGKVEVSDSGGNHIKIFSTVLAMLEDFVEENDPQVIEFTAKSDEESRVDLYNKMTKVLGRKYGYEVKNTTYGYEEEYILRKK